MIPWWILAVSIPTSAAIGFFAAIFCVMAKEHNE